MKRLLSLVLSLVLLLACVSLSMAAVTLGGNMRVWYQNTTDKTNPAPNADQNASTFRFDRLAITFASELSAIDGFKGEVQFRSLRSDKTQNDSIVRIDNAYFYHKALFMDTDEFDAGVIQQLPFRNTAYNAILLESLANKLVKDTNSVGIKYSGTVDQFNYAFALVNSNNQNDFDYAANMGDGLDYGFRFGFAPMSNLNIGLGYIDDFTTNGNEKTAYVVDTNGKFGPFGIYFEYLSLTPTKNGNSLDAGTAAYYEASYQVSAPFSVYVGRSNALQAQDQKNNIYGSSYLNGVDFYDALPSSASGAGKFTFNNDWSLIGVKYQLAPNTALQAEYIVQDSLWGYEGKDKNVFAARLKVDF